MASSLDCPTRPAATSGDNGSGRGIGDHASMWSDENPSNQRAAFILHRVVAVLMLSFTPAPYFLGGSGGGGVTT